MPWMPTHGRIYKLGLCMELEVSMHHMASRVDSAAQLWKKCLSNMGGGAAGQLKEMCHESI